MRQDGLGDFTSVVEALLAAGDGDSVVVGPGFYDEDGINHDIVAQGLVFSGVSDDPSVTTIRNIRLRFYPTESVVVANLRFYQCSNPLLLGRTNMVLRNCVFERNRGSFMPGAVVAASSGDLLIEDCAFINNTNSEFQPDGGAAVSAIGPLVIRRCFFYGNRGTGEGGAVSLTHDSVVEECTFLGNEADIGGAIYILGEDVVIDRCTLWGNMVLGKGAALDFLGQGVHVEHTIIAGTKGGFGVACRGTGVFNCCNVWGNELGDYAEEGWWCLDGAGRGNISEDPLFCDSLEADLRLGEGSPCLPGVHGGVECGQIGAYGLGCGMSTVISLTWGRLKSLYEWPSSIASIRGRGSETRVPVMTGGPEGDQ